VHFLYFDEYILGSTYLKVKIVWKLVGKAYKHEMAMGLKHLWRIIPEE